MSRLQIGLLVTFLKVIPVPLLGADSPNIVYVMADDMGAGHVSCFGGDRNRITTVHLDQLAASGMRFTDAYSLPLCSPTRATILSGQYPTRHLVTTASGHQPPQQPGQSLYPAKASPTQPLIYAKSKNYLEPEQVLIRAVRFQNSYEAKLQAKQLTYQELQLAQSQRLVEDERGKTESKSAEIEAAEKELRGDRDKELQTVRSENEVAIAGVRIAITRAGFALVIAAITSIGIRVTVLA